MAAELTQITDLAEWPAFRRKVRAAMVKAALAVASEQPDPSNPSRSQLRRALSTNIIQRQEDYITPFAVAVAANPVIGYESSDSDIEFTVNSVYDAIAGAPPAPAP